MLIPKLSIAYETAMLYSFFAIRDPKSKANPEKVVKPPNIPTAIKLRKREFKKKI